MNFDNYVNIIKDRLSTKRFEHSMRVVDTALEMSKAYDIPQEKVAVAALLHDYAKDMSPKELVAESRVRGLLIYTAEEVQPDLLHGPLGASLCREELNITDEEILNAIHYHTTGRVNMSLLEVIIYLADLIEPGRSYEGIETLQKICRQNVENALLYAFDATLKFVIKRNMLIHPLTVEARNWIILKS